MSKKRIILFISIIALIGAILLFYNNYKNTININDDKYTILSESTSPDNKFTAYVLEYNGGITTDWQVGVALTSNNSIFKDRGNVMLWVNHSKELKINWNNPSQLTIFHNSNNEDMLKKITNFKNIQIDFKLDTSIPKLR